MEGSEFLESKKIFSPPLCNTEITQEVSFLKDFKPAMELAFGEDKGVEHKISSESL